MNSYTRYLTAISRGDFSFSVEVSEESPAGSVVTTQRLYEDWRFSPILPAFLLPGEHPAPPPSIVDSVVFLFSPKPYIDLGILKQQLSAEERAQTYFSEGHASVILLNRSFERAMELWSSIDGCAFEFWPIKNGTLIYNEVVSRLPPIQKLEGPIDTSFAPCDTDISVYVDQIHASLSTLWATYTVYYPKEIYTLRRLLEHTNQLVERYSKTSSLSEASPDVLQQQKQRNSIVSALVELSAALSYAVTQGASGITPILANRSPFPHHSLLGIGTAVRALTNFARYLERAFMTRSASEVIAGRYSIQKHFIPASIADYRSGNQYKLPERQTTQNEEFDAGSEYRQRDHIPLIAHFSLRHGFMESKFSVTAASESLTAETLPQWTLMTLSHEIMHSRVRSIFQALFGHHWDDVNDSTAVRKAHYDGFVDWIKKRRGALEVIVEDGLRNSILNFCMAMDVVSSPTDEDEDSATSELNHDRLNEAFTKHKQLAIEVAVHFHDYYFAYAYQPKMYLMSLWASWLKVAAPYTRPLEYLTRSLATVACGTGLAPREAFDFASEALIDALDGLVATGVNSPLFDELRRLLQDPSLLESTRAQFKPLYYLIDQIRLFFASPKIASNIDRIESDPFAEGSTDADEYSSSVYVYGESGLSSPSPIRYSTAALFRSLTKKSAIDDPQWLTAWNYMVISSLEVE